MSLITTLQDGVFPLDSLSDNEVETIFTTFWNSGLHGENWPNVVFAIVACKVGGRKCLFGAMNTPSSKNPRNGRRTRGEHTVEKVITFLEEALDDVDNDTDDDSDSDSDSDEESMLKDVRKAFEASSCYTEDQLTLYVNYSPCSSCSSKIVGLMKSYLEPRHVSLQVVVAALYRISRPSCADCTHALPSDQDHDRNVRGLQSLQDAGVTLRTFNSQGKQDWNYLKEALGAEGIKYRGSSRKSEDEDLLNDLEAVLEEDESEDSFPTQVDGFDSSNPFHGQLHVTSTRNAPTFQSRGPVRDDLSSSRNATTFQSRGPVRDDLSSSRNATTFQSRSPVRDDVPDGAAPVITLPDNTDETDHRVQKKNWSFRCTIL